MAAASAVAILMAGPARGSSSWGRAVANILISPAQAGPKQRGWNSRRGRRRLGDFSSGDAQNAQSAQSAQEAQQRAAEAQKRVQEAVAAQQQRLIQVQQNTLPQKAQERIQERIQQTEELQKRLQSISAQQLSATDAYRQMRQAVAEVRKRSAAMRHATNSQRTIHHQALVRSVMGALRHRSVGHWRHGIGSRHDQLRRQIWARLGHRWRRRDNIPVPPNKGVGGPFLNAVDGSTPQQEMVARLPDVASRGPGNSSRDGSGMSRLGGPKDGKSDDKDDGSDGSGKGRRGLLGGRMSRELLPPPGSFRNNEVLAVNLSAERLKHAMDRQFRVVERIRYPALGFEVTRLETPLALNALIGRSTLHEMFPDQGFGLNRVYTTGPLTGTQGVKDAAVVPPSAPATAPPVAPPSDTPAPPPAAAPSETVPVAPPTAPANETAATTPPATPETETAKAAPAAPEAEAAKTTPAASESEATKTTPAQGHEAVKSAAAPTTRSAAMAVRPGARCTADRCFGTRVINWQPELSNCARGIRVGVIDTGFDRSHPAFAHLTADRLKHEVFIPAGAKKAPNQHGTGVFALLAGDTRGSTPGLVPDATFFVGDAFFSDRNGNAMSDTVSMLRALDWLKQSRVDVANLSFAGPLDDLVHDAIRELAKAGTVILAAAGNEGQDAPPSYPAAYREVVAVTAVDRNLAPYMYANRGSYIAVAAPGVDVWTALPGRREGPQSGTSFAVPFATSVVALSYRAEHERAGRYDPLEPRRQALELLQKDIKVIGGGRSPVFGAGLVQAPAHCDARGPGAVASNGWAGTVQRAVAAPSPMGMWSSTVRPVAKR